MPAVLAQACIRNSSHCFQGKACSPPTEPVRQVDVAESWARALGTPAFRSWSLPALLHLLFCASVFPPVKWEWHPVPGRPLESNEGARAVSVCTALSSALHRTPMQRTR